jgi:DNA-binding LytR/AlgR family response regulator
MTESSVSPVFRAILADDERLLREQLQARLAECWPELQVCGFARDGLEAVRMAEELQPNVVFLDIRMPGLTGIEAAREMASQDNWRGEIVFVTAYDEYAVTAFEEGAVDYLLKPVERVRLDVTVARLRARLAQASPPDHQGALLHTLAQLQTRLNGDSAPRLRWLQCGVGTSTKLVNVDDVLFFRSDEKYTRVQLAGQEALIRTPIRELISQLDPQQFWQIHRATIVNLGAIAAVQRDDAGRQRVSLKQHPELLEVSRSFGHLFRAA